MNPFFSVADRLKLSVDSQGDGYGYLHFALQLSGNAFDAESDSESDPNPFAAVLRRWRATGLLAGKAGQRFEAILNDGNDKYARGVRP